MVMHDLFRRETNRQIVIPGVITVYVGQDFISREKRKRHGNV